MGADVRVLTCSVAFGRLAARVVGGLGTSRRDGRIVRSSGAWTDLKPCSNGGGHRHGGCVQDAHGHDQQRRCVQGDKQDKP